MFWRYRPPGSGASGLQVAIFAYFDQYLLIFFFHENILPNICQNRQKWPSGGLEPGGLYLQNKKLGVCNYKTQFLSGITFNVSYKIKPVIQIYENVSDVPSPLCRYSS